MSRFIWEERNLVMKNDSRLESVKVSNTNTQALSLTCYVIQSSQPSIK